MDKKMLNLRWWLSVLVALTATAFMLSMEKGMGLAGSAAAAGFVAIWLATFFGLTTTAVVGYAGGAVTSATFGIAFIALAVTPAAFVASITVFAVGCAASATSAAFVTRCPKNERWSFWRTFIFLLATTIAAIPAGFWLYTVHPAYGIGVFIADIVAIYSLWPLCRKEYTAPILGA